MVAGTAVVLGAGLIAARVLSVAAQEDGRFAVALSGVLGEQPPLDGKGFRRFADSLGAVAGPWRQR